MIGLGVNAGDRVAIWSPNTWHWVVACLATHYAGAVVVPLEHPLHRRRGHRHPGPHRRSPTDRRWANSSAPTGSATSTARRCPLCGTSCGCPSMTTTGRGTSSSATGSDLTAADARAAAVTPDDVSDVLFTSGTTGRSKGVLCAHRQSLDAPAAVGGLREDHQRRPLPLHQPVLPQFRLQGRDPGVPADRRHSDPAADVRPRPGDARGSAPADHRASRAADDLSDAARPPHPRRLRPELAAVRGHRRGDRPRRPDRAHAERTRHRRSC